MCALFFRFRRCRSLEMEKLAELKHGYNKENNAILDKCQKLGMAIVTFDLLKIKHFNAIDFEKVMTVTSTVKGAAFILYNVARLQTLLASFDHQVSSGFYAPLPHIDDVDFGLLKEEVRVVCHLFVYFSRYFNICVAKCTRPFPCWFILMLLFGSDCFCFIFVFINNRKSGRCSLCTSLDFHRCWSDASAVLTTVKSPSICCARFWAICLRYSAYTTIALRS